MSERAIRRLFAIIDAQRWDELSTLFCADVVYDRPGFEQIVGFAALDQFYRSVRAVAHGRHCLERVLATETDACCWGSFTGVATSGSPLHEKFSDWYGFDGGLIRVRRTFFYRPAM